MKKTVLDGIVRRVSQTLRLGEGRLPGTREPQGKGELTILICDNLRRAVREEEEEVEEVKRERAACIEAGSMVEEWEVESRVR